MTHGSLFSGIGGFDLAAHWAGIQNIFACEIDEFCRKVLTKRFPNTILFNDIKETNFEQFNGRVDIISGGFPCQPFSVAGKRAGTEDNRYLWGEMLRVVREVQPTWVIAENVRGLLSINDGDTYETVCDDLEVSGYEVQPFIIPALSVGAPHKRERLWIIGKRNTSNSNDNQSQFERCDNQNGSCPSESWQGNGIGTSVGNEVGNPTKRIRELGRSTENLFTPNLTDTDSGRLERTEEERRQGEYTLRSDSGITPTTPNPEGVRYGRGRDGNDRNDRKRFICENEQDNGHEIRSEITSSNEFDIANTDNGGRSQNEIQTRGAVNDVCYTGEWNEHWTEAITRIYGMDDGLPGGVDRLEQRYKDRSRKYRIKAMGNAIVPQIAHLIFKTILEAEREYYA